MAIKRLIFLILGLIFLALGTVGVFLPILPTVPFYLATVFCFSQSSQKLYDCYSADGIRFLQDGKKRHPDSVYYPYCCVNLSHCLFRVWCENHQQRKFKAIKQMPVLKYGPAFVK